MASAARDDDRAARWGERLLDGALRIVFSVAIALGFSFALVPALQILGPDYALLSQKLMSETGGTVATIAVGLALLWAGRLLLHRLVLRRQAVNDRVAQGIVDTLRADPRAPVEDFYLYLRAFETTGKLRVPLHLRLRKAMVGLPSVVTSDAESYVSHALRTVAPLVGLGRPGEAIGAGRALTDDASWQRDVTALMERAKAILLVPSSRPGTLWEIEALRREAVLTRVVFVMPPRSTGAFDTRQRWAEAQRAMAAQGLEAPDYQDRGLFFEVGPDGRVSNVEPMLLDSPRQVRKSMARLLADDPPRGGLSKAVARARRRARRARLWGWVETTRQLSPYIFVLLALLAGRPEVGFDAHEPWSVVYDRSTTLRTIGAYPAPWTLPPASSPGYRALEATVPPAALDDWRAEQVAEGVGRLDDQRVHDYFLAWAEMLDRVDTKSCAAIARGDIGADAMMVALSYMPSAHVLGYLEARNAALVAAVTKAPVQALDERTDDALWGRFHTSLGADGRRRLERITTAGFARSDDTDTCWAARQLFGQVAVLPEPDATRWARSIAPAASDSAG